MSKYDDEQFEEIPFVKNLKTQKQLLETLKELHSGELFASLKLQDIANRLSLKSDKKLSALKVSAMIKSIFGDYVIEIHKSRYFAVIYIDTLNELLKKATERYVALKGE
jgi:hypothetical protein